MNKQTAWVESDPINKDSILLTGGEEMKHVKKLESVYVFTEEELSELKSAQKALKEISEIPAIKDLNLHNNGCVLYQPLVEAVKKICQPVVPLTEDQIDQVLSGFKPAMPGKKGLNGHPDMYNQQQVLGFIKNTADLILQTKKTKNE